MNSALEGFRHTNGTAGLFIGSRSSQGANRGCKSLFASPAMAYNEPIIAVNAAPVIWLSRRNQTTMSGPIVRTAPTPEFSKNWERVFGKKKAATEPAAKATTKPTKKKKPAKSKK